MHYSSIEALETRIAPASLGVTDVFVDASDLTVSLSNGLLKVMPKSGATDLDVSIELLPDGSLLVSDSTGDDDLEDTPNFHGLVRSIQATLTAGDDHLSVLLDSGFTIAGGLAVNTGLGFDQVEIHEGVLRGNVTISGKGSVDVNVGTDSLDDVNIRGLLSSTVTGGGEFHFGAGAKAGALTAIGSSDFILEGLVIGNTMLTAKTGDTSFQIGGIGGSPTAAVGGNLTITGVAGSDDVFVGDALVRGGMTLNLGAGNNLATIGTDANILGVAKILGTTGDDTVVLGTIGSAGPGIHGRLSVTLGNGTNEFTAHSGLISGGLSFTGGTGADTVNLGADLTVFADAKIATRDGANVVNVESFSSLWKFNLTTGVDTDTVTLNAVGAGYLIGVVGLGGGTDALTILGSADFFSTFKTDGGLGTDTLAINPLVLDNGLSQKGFETLS